MEELSQLASAAGSFGMTSGEIDTSGFWIGLVSKTGLRTIYNAAEWMWLSTGQTPEFNGWRFDQPDDARMTQGLTARVSPAVFDREYRWGKPCFHAELA